MERLTQKTSTILIAAGKRTRVYRSVAEVPPLLRRRLLQSTSGANSATVLIADEGGRREILRSLGGGGRSPATTLVRTVSGRRRKEGDPLMGRRQWVEIGLLGGIGLCLWLLVAWK